MTMPIAKQLPSRDYLLSKIKYTECSKTGLVCSTTNRILGVLSGNGYYTTRIDGKVYYNHRLIVYILGENIDDLLIDHIDGNKTNNNRANLRIVNDRQNSQNSAIRCDNKSGIKGVDYTLKMEGFPYWRAQYKDLSGKSVYKSFSINRFGNEIALQLAINWRLTKILEMNKNGMDYTERHILGN